MSPYVTLEQLRGAAAYVAANWGDHGYRVAADRETRDGVLFSVRCSDGSRFSILVDRWGNASLPTQCLRGNVSCPADAPLVHECPR